MATSTSTQLGHVLLASTPSRTSRYAQATGLIYDIRTDGYGPGPYTLKVNHGRVGDGTIGWVVHRDGSYGVVAGVMIFDGTPVHREADGLDYKNGLLWPLPSDYWIDGARIRLKGWSGGAPFKPPPNNFQNGVRVLDADAKILMRLCAPPVQDWLTHHSVLLS